MSKNILMTLLITILFFTFGGGLSQAQTTANPDSALRKILDSLDGIKLSLSNALELSQKNSTSVRQSQALYLSSLGAVRREKGTFDPELYFNLIYTDEEIPSASFFSGAPVLSNQQTNSSLGFRWNAPIGTQLELSLNSITLKTNSQFAFLNPEYDAFGSISLRQPLLNGFIKTGELNLNQAELNLESAKAQYDQEVLNVNSLTEQTYWNLYAAERNYAVQKLNLDFAESLFKEALVRKNAGLVGPNQVANAKTFLAEQKLSLLDMEELLDSRSDQLSFLIGSRPGSGKTRFLTVDSPPSNFVLESVDLLVDYALNNNFELIAAKKNIEIAGELIDAASWQKFPQIDLVGKLTSNAVGGSSQDVIFGGDTLRSAINGNYGDVLSQVFKRNFPGWSLGIELTLPIGLRKPLGEIDRLEADELNAKEKFAELSRLLENQIRSSYRELTNGNQRINAAREGVDAAQEQVRIGMIEFKNGRISAFELVRLSRDLAEAQLRYSDALVKIVKASSDLKKLTSGYYPLFNNR